MDIDFLLDIFVRLLTAGIGLTSVIIPFKTISNNVSLNKQNILNGLVKQETEIRIKLNEYRREIHNVKLAGEDWKEIPLDYDTLLFNYYEYVFICVYKELIVEEDAKRYFGNLFIYVREQFNYSILFKEEYAEKEQYPGLQWLFKRWNAVKA